jgi:hypothetical protein
MAGSNRYGILLGERNQCFIGAAPTHQALARSLTKRQAEANAWHRNTTSRLVSTSSRYGRAMMYAIMHLYG